MELFYDKRISVYDKGQKVNEKTFDKIKKYLNRMDQDKYTNVIFGNNDKYITIGGGNDNYIVFVTTDKEYYNLLNTNCINEIEEVNLVAGGQSEFFQKRKIVNYELMINACEYYYKNKDMSPKLTWENGHGSIVEIKDDGNEIKSKNKLSEMES